MMGEGCPYASTRALEIGLAFLMLNCGIVLVWEGQTFDLPHYGIVEQYISEANGGLLFIIAGMARLAALWVNGFKARSPLIRFVGCLIGVGFWATMFVAVEEAIRQQPAIPLVVPISLTMVGCEFYSAIRCASDASRLGSLPGWFRMHKRVRVNGGIS